ncbi:MAG: N-acetyltransferase, partial [Lachnospiraceae bacterium]|nr:N-acetyltransferase [Lachnospiraceae bacterium]
MVLVNQEITIRNAEKQDAQILADWWNDGDVMAHAGFPLGLGTNAEKIAGELSTDSDDRRRRLILEAGGKPVGEMSYTIFGENDTALNIAPGFSMASLYDRPERGELTAELGIKICETDYQEKGIVRRALSLLIRELFRRGVSRIILDTNLKNTRAQHVYEKLGFVKQGVRIDSWRDPRGALQSAVDYAMTEEEFNDFSGESEEYPTWSWRACTLSDLARVWDMNISDHPGSEEWARYRVQAFYHEEKKIAKTYIALRNGKPVGEGTLLFSPDCRAVRGREGLADGAYSVNVNGLRIRKEYEGQGYTSRLMKVMEEDAARLGFRIITIGVDA